MVPSNYGQVQHRGGIDGGLNQPQGLKIAKLNYKLHNLHTSQNV